MYCMYPNIVSIPYFWGKQKKKMKLSKLEVLVKGKADSKFYVKLLALISSLKNNTVTVDVNYSRAVSNFHVLS